MLFTDHFFILYFFPLFLLIYFFSRNIRYRNVVIVILSLFFYASFGLYNLPIFIIPLFLDYAAGIYLEKLKRERYRKLLVFLVVVGNLGLLGYYKYFIFLENNFGEIFSKIGIHLSSYSVAATLIPLGISFITFQRISYIVDIYRRKIRAERSFLYYATYASLFPHLISGPIVRYSNISKSLAKRKVSLEYIFEGCKFFIIGFFLKIAVADKLFLVESFLIKPNTELHFFEAIMLVFYFSLRIYIDFVGYSLIAIGLAKFLGFDFPSNFLSPYQAGSITEFWRKWNVTLSNWLRDYLYIPLGGNRKGTIRTYVHLLITMILGGLWHGANWNFMIWGFLHGLFLAIERFFVDNNYIVPIPLFLRRILVFTIVSFAWLTFLFTEPGQIQNVFSAIFRLEFISITPELFTLFISSIPSLLIACIWAFVIEEEKLKNLKANLFVSVVLTILFVYSLGNSFLFESVPFIYFQF